MIELHYFLQRSISRLPVILQAGHSQSVMIGQWSYATPLERPCKGRSYRAGCADREVRARQAECQKSSKGMVISRWVSMRRTEAASEYTYTSGRRHVNCNVSGA